MMAPKLAIVIPCYNEETVLPRMVPVFVEKIRGLVRKGLVAEGSFLLFCDDGSSDGTWPLIKRLSTEEPVCRGLSLSRNCGQQSVLMAGLMEAKESADIVITADCDGQDDIDAMDGMVEKYLAGAQVVYGVRSVRSSDTWFKRVTAESFYHIMRWLGSDIVFNHSEYRLMSSRVLEELERYGEVNMFLRGMFRFIGFKSDVVYYERSERIAGESHYPFLKLLDVAWTGATSLSIRPIHMVVVLGFLFLVSGVALAIWCLVAYLIGSAVFGWLAGGAGVCVVSGVQLLCVGVIGEYVGKIYLEVKHRPRYVIAERT